MPLHVAIVHFPIALFTLSVVLDVAGFAGGGNAVVRGAAYTLLFGLIGAALAAVPGLADYTSIRRDHPARVTATWHMVLNVTAVVLYAISLGLRWGRLDLQRVPVWPFVLSILGLVVIGISGYLGGELVYGDGIGVGRHRRRAPMPGRTIEAEAGAAEATGFVQVANVDALNDGTTLRVDVAGTIMTLVRVDGEVCALQEFCTHRCGPLSEGSIEGGQIRCPWHNSRFNVRTGKVTHGPAKVDLKVYASQVRDGRVWVRAGEPAASAPPAIVAGRGQSSPAGSGRTEMDRGDDEAKAHPDRYDSPPATVEQEDRRLD
jgi:nitrite reductase/ring-hydroxylating ferredoxin subunit/uncharacterized membrane protein